MSGIGLIEAIYLLLIITSIIWVYHDAPKFGMNRYLAILLVLLVTYPIGFVIYLLLSRFRKPNTN